MKKSQSAWLASLWFLFFMSYCGVVAADTRVPVEERIDPLSKFPQTQLAILTPDARRHVFKIWVADTESHREQGLMFVKSLDPDTGMIFLFEPPQVINMWMKNTYIPLDMVFIDGQGRVTKVVENATPLSRAIISSVDQVNGVIELKGGVTRELGIREGAMVGR